MELNEIRQSVERIVAEVASLNSDAAVNDIAEHDSLIDSGFIDSLSAVQLIDACQNAFDITIFPAELSIDNFDSIARITEFVASKLNGQDDQE